LHCYAQKLAHNDAWLNAGPRALIAFTADNADVKFPLRLPIQAETHEVLPADVRKHPLCGAKKPSEQARDMQEVMAAIAGYFGGYSSKMQSIGERETRQLREAAQRKVAVETKNGDAQDFHKYVRRLVKDLEMKGTSRTAVEGVNLSLFANRSDVLMTECIRTFPTVIFPASLLLKREEVETYTVSGASIIAALHHGHGCKARMYLEAPFDLMYGFRGSEHSVDLLTPYEMLLHYSMERILPPASQCKSSRATWTVDGIEYCEQCQKKVSSLVFSLVYLTWHYLHTIAFCYLICQLFVDFDIAGVGSLVQALIRRFGLLPKCLVRNSRSKKIRRCFRSTPGVQT
jgi:hypothetical protein